MGEKTNLNGKVESDTTNKTERIIRTQRVMTDAEDGMELLAHFSYLDGTFYVAMKRGKLEGFEKTFASGFYYCETLPSPDPENGDASEWIWMPVETAADERYLFSVKPWEESGLLPAQQKKTAKKLKEAFGQFRKEMLP